MFGTIMNDEDIKVIQTDDTAAEDIEQVELSDEELEQFYEDNRDAIDLILADRKSVV